MWGVGGGREQARKSERVRERERERATEGGECLGLLGQKDGVGPEPERGSYWGNWGSLFALLTP